MTSVGRILQISDIPDCGDTESRINVKLKTASNERHLDQTNLQTKVQKQTHFKINELKESSQQQPFNLNVKNNGTWRAEINQFMSKDYGNDLKNVQNLQKKHVLQESEVAAHQNCINGTAV